MQLLIQPPDGELPARDGFAKKWRHWSQEYRFSRAAKWPRGAAIGELWLKRGCGEVISETIGRSFRRQTFVAIAISVELGAENETHNLMHKAAQYGEVEDSALRVMRLPTSTLTSSQFKFQ